MKWSDPVFQTDVVFQLALAIIPMILAITLHETAHGFAALALGDDTARKAKRLSLNPLRHVDRVGTLLLPGFLVLSQLLTLGRVAFIFGWAKPVPVAAWKAALALPAGQEGMADHPVITLFLFQFLLFNLVLGLFNLLPIPPLDGGRIVAGLLPERLARSWGKLERAGLVIVIVAVFLLPLALRGIGIAFDPFGDALQAVVPWAIRLVMRLAGHDAGDVDVNL
jgi:Zn-dependent protease